MANNFKVLVSRNVGTTPVSVVTAPIPSQTTVIGMTVANTTSSPITVDVYIGILGQNYYLVKGALVPVGGSLVPIGGEQKLVLIGTAGRNDTLNVVSSAASSVDAIVSLLEIS